MTTCATSSALSEIPRVQLQVLLHQALLGKIQLNLFVLSKSCNYFIQPWSSRWFPIGGKSAPNSIQGKAPAQPHHTHPLLKGSPRSGNQEQQCFQRRFPLSACFHIIRRPHLLPSVLSPPHSTSLRLNLQHYTISLPTARDLYP
jgi:hypothetical protein